MAEAFKVKDISLAGPGRLKIDWAESRMPVLMELRRQHEKTKPLSGHRLAGCLHVTKETAVLVRTLRAAGAEIAWCGSNPLSTQDDVAAALADDGVRIFAWHGMSVEEFYWAIGRTLDIRPTLTLDDGADLVATLHDRRPELVKGVLGGTEETTTGVRRARAMAAAGRLLYPVLAVNDAQTKRDFDNVYGTGQSSVDGILRATSVLLGGKTLVVAGYGKCGTGCAMRAQGLGAHTVITEVDPIPAIRATLDGHRVMTMDAAALIGDIFITATGMKDVIVERHFERMRDGAIVCNTGHYDVEVSVPDLAKLSSSVRTIRDNCDEYRMSDGRRIYLLAKGRLVNLSAAEGHPSEVMDMSFANQFLALLRVAAEGKALAPGVHEITREQDQQIASAKLGTLGISIDSLTDDQKRYATEFGGGT